jgi:Photosystem I psaA/psaB protein
LPRSDSLYLTDLVRDDSFNARGWFAMFVIKHRAFIVSHLCFMSLFLGFHTLGLYVHNDVMQACACPEILFGIRSSGIVLAAIRLEIDDPAVMLSQTVNAFTFQQIINPIWMWWSGSWRNLCLFVQMYSTCCIIILSFVSGWICQESRQVTLDAALITNSNVGGVRQSESILVVQPHSRLGYYSQVVDALYHSEACRLSMWVIHVIILWFAGQNSARVWRPVFQHSMSCSPNSECYGVNLLFSYRRSFPTLERIYNDVAYSESLDESLASYSHFAQTSENTITTPII